MALGLISVKIQINNCWCGLSLNNVKLPPNCFLIGIVREDQVISASTEPTIYCGDELLGLTMNSAQVPALKFLLQKTHPIYYSFDECLLNKLNIPVRS
ncbi:MAG TPA: TrkA C-terminal domain-containing protein [Trichormus sp. M33_DOE_039]|nr:TrkA C-terminal domain-containing protein [Trichormus sp. M33_DOE_039]